MTLSESRQTSEAGRMNAAMAAAPSAFASQSAFRTILNAMARPGVIETITEKPEGPSQLDAATDAVALSLFDHDTKIWLGDGIACLEVYDYLKLNCSCPLIKSGLEADFALLNASDGIPGLAQFSAGTDPYPERSTTLIVQVGALDEGFEVNLTGPGIETQAALRVRGMPDYFWQERREQQTAFPRGVDVIFTCGDRLVALPRSTEIEV